MASLQVARAPGILGRPKQYFRRCVLLRGRTLTECQMSWIRTCVCAPIVETGRDTWACRLLGGSQAPITPSQPNRDRLSNNRAVNAAAAWKLRARIRYLGAGFGRYLRG